MRLEPVLYFIDFAGSRWFWPKDYNWIHVATSSKPVLTKPAQHQGPATHGILLTMDSWKYLLPTFIWVLCVCVGVCVCMHAHARVPLCVCRSGNNSWELIFFPPCRSQDLTWVLRLSDKCPYLLSHLSVPLYSLWENKPLLIKKPGLLFEKKTLQTYLDFKQNFPINPLYPLSEALP